MQLQREIDNLNETLLRMADVVLANIKTSFHAYKKEEKASIINDDLVDQYE